MPLRTALARLVALVCGIVLSGMAVYGMQFVLLAAFLSAEVPDPLGSSGAPESWGEVAGNIAWVLAAVIAEMLLVSAAVALLAWGATGRWPRLIRLALIPAGSLALALVLFAVALVPRIDEVRERPDCDTFAVSPAAWRGAGVDDQLTVSYGVEVCGALAGKTRSEVRALLGPPDTSTDTYWTYQTLDVSFADGRVSETQATPQPELD
jgi:hypothetical protein